MTIKKRLVSKTPDFWKKAQKIGIIAGTIGGALLAAPAALPAVVISIGGYLVAVGTVTAALSQLTVEGVIEENTENK